MSITTTGAGQPTDTAAAAGFSYDAVTFDGTNDYLTRGGALSGVSDGTTAIMAFWIRKPTSAFGQLISNVSGQDGCWVDTAVQPGFYDSFGANGIYKIGVTSINDGNWHSVLISVDTSVPILHLYIDDVDDGTTQNQDGTPGTLFFSDTDWAIGADGGGANKLSADLAEFYFAPGQFLDFSVTANRRKFIDASNKPVDLGSDGSTPTGTAPAVYQHIAAAGTPSDFGTNLGSGGGMTITGTLALASSKP